MLRSICTLAALSIGAAAQATPVRFVALGHVEYNQFLAGTFFGQPVGAPCRLQVNLNSDVYLDNPMYPVRGYIFGVSDLTMTIGSVTVGPRSTETTNYFCVRNNDPAVDGVFLSKGTGFDTEIPLAMTPNNYGIGFLRTFTGTITFPSLNITECTGSWAYENMSSYNFNIQRGEGSTPLGIWYDSFSITAQCGKADLGSQGGIAEFDGRLDNNDFVVFIDRFFAGDPVADQGVQGGEPGSDGAFDNNDFVVFIANFFAGCA